MAVLAFQTNRQYQNKSETLFRGVSREAQYVEKQFAEVYGHMTYPITRQTDLHKFCNLAITWKEETKLSSSIRDIALNQSYLEIIGMGKKALPFIFEDLQIKPTHWFAALRAITGFSPIKRAHRGNIRLMSEDWLKWGEENGYI